MLKNKNVKIFFKGQAKEVYTIIQSRRDKNSKTILNSIKRTINILKENPQYGNPIAKTLIPEKYSRLEIKKLYRVELANYWRMLYTIEGDKIKIFLFILDIRNHKDYNKLFGYK